MLIGEFHLTLKNNKYLQMKHIMLLTDFSNNAWNAIVYASQIFKDQKCTFTILNSFDSSVPHSTAGIVSARMNEAVYDSLKKQSEDGLEATLFRLTQEPNNTLHTYETLSIHGTLLDVVLGLIAEHSPNYVVVGAKGETGLREVAMGSSVASLIAKVLCPLLVIPENAVYNGVSEIAFSTDYEINYSEKGLKPFLELCRAIEAEISVFYVNENGDSLDVQRQTKQNQLMQLLGDRNPKFFMLTDVSVTIGARLFVESRTINMLCLIAKKHNFMTRFFGTSQTKSITKQTQIPLLILHNDSF